MSIERYVRLPLLEFRQETVQALAIGGWDVFPRDVAAEDILREVC